MLEPISEICAWILFFDPWPMASMVMTDATPMMIPKHRKERAQLVVIQGAQSYFK